MPPPLLQQRSFHLLHLRRHSVSWTCLFVCCREGLKTPRCIVRSHIWYCAVLYGNVTGSFDLTLEKTCQHRLGNSRQPPLLSLCTSIGEMIGTETRPLTECCSFRCNRVQVPRRVRNYLHASVISGVFEYRLGSAKARSTRQHAGSFLTFAAPSAVLRSLLLRSASCLSNGPFPKGWIVCPDLRLGMPKGYTVGISRLPRASWLLRLGSPFECKALRANHVAADDQYAESL